MELIADSLDVDLRWLYGQNVPMEHTSQNDNSLQYVFYNNSCSEYLLDNLDDIYIAMMTQYAALIPRFLCPCQSCWKCNAHITFIFERGIVPTSMNVRLISSIPTGILFLQEILKVFTWY